MRLLMAQSADRYLCSGPDDDMSWTGPTDKKVFRLLTGVGGVCAAGSTTWRLMPRLDGRELIPISRGSFTLRDLQYRHPDAWLLGGPTVARAALQLGYVSEVHLCTVIGARLGGGVKTEDALGKHHRGRARRTMTTTVGGLVTVDVFRL